jgi:hypothetical protein
MAGTFDAVTGRLTLTATRWLLQPYGYVTVGLLSRRQFGRPMAGKDVGSN